MKRAVLSPSAFPQSSRPQQTRNENSAIAARMGARSSRSTRITAFRVPHGRDKCPAFDALCRDAAKRKFDVVMAWSVDRLGRSLQDLVAFLSELHALRIDLFLHSARPRRDDAGRQGHVSDDGRICRIRAFDHR